MRNHFYLKDFIEHYIRLLNTKRLNMMLLSITIMAVFFHTTANAQDTRRITGKVVFAADGEPAPGTSVKIKGQTNATITDATGSFAIQAKTGDLLEIVYLGFDNQTIKVGESSDVGIIKLVENSLQLSEIEVVAVGYGTAKRSDLTGSISSISAKDIQENVSATFDQALQGRVAGVIVNSNSGQPGGGISVQVRGTATLGNAQPLYVIDGVFFDGGDTNSQVYTGGAPTTNPLATINPADIESIDVLKDASAAAIYGSRGSNGVVIITTKKGKSGKSKITFDSYYSLQQLPDEIPVLNLQEFAAFRNERDRVFFNTPNPLFQDPSVLGLGTNWQDAIFQNAPMQSYNLSISGGNEKTTYLVSGGYFDQEGIAIKSGFKRVNGKINLEQRPTTWLKLGTNVQLTNTKELINNQEGSLISLAIRQSPDIAAVNPDGSFGGPSTSEFQITNPFGLTQINTNERMRNQAYGNIYADITFLKDFVLRNEVAGNFESGDIVQFSPSYQFGQLINNNSFSRRSNSTYSGKTIRSYLTYNHTFKQLRVNGTLGHETVLNTSGAIDAQASGFITNVISELNFGNPLTAVTSSSKAQNALDSYYARFNLSYNDKFTITPTFRRDASSRFSPDNRVNYSYAIGGAYRVTQEKFMSKFKVVNDLKLRLSYGLQPNQNVGNYVYGTSFRPVSTGLGLGLLINNLANPDAKWENTKTTNAGIDLSLFNYRITLSADVYDKDTDGLLSSLALPLYSGTTPNDQFTVAKLTAPTKNIGSINNKGFEFSLNTQNIKTKNFNWVSTFTYSANKNKVTSLVTQNTVIPQFLNNEIVSQVAVGRSIGEFYGYIVEGVYKDAQDLNTHPRSVNNTTGQPLPIGIASIWVGDLKYKDVNADGKIDNADRVYLGSPIPKFQFGVNNNFKYKAFDLTVFINGNYGNKIFNGLKQQNENVSSTGGFGFLQSVRDYAKIGLINPAGSATDVNNLYILNPETSVPRLSSSDANQNNRPSTRYIEDGSYVRLKNVVFGYTLPNKLISKIKMSNARVYANLQNAFTITNYSGYDPEVGSRYQNATSAGIDFGRYPSQRVFTFGITAGF